MRIVSKFKDYYDNGCVNGIDPLHTYIRKTEEIPVKLKTVQFSRECEWATYNIIGFCGNIYICKIYNDLNSSDFFKKFPKHAKVFFGEDAILKYIDYNYDTNKILNHNKRSFPFQRLKAWYDSIIKNNELKGLFLKFNTPIFVINSDYNPINTVTINPNLKEYYFYKIKDVNSAFRDIEYYISNVLVNDDISQVALTDSQKIEAKGFDSSSFKKEFDTRKRKGKSKKCR